MTENSQALPRLSVGTAMPPSTCIVHGPFVGVMCPRCSSVMPGSVPFQPADPAIYSTPPITTHPRITMPDEQDPTAQDVIDALRIALMAQKDPAEAIKIVNMLVEFAPETSSNRGIDLLLTLISEASLKVSMVDG